MTSEDLDKSVRRALYNAARWLCDTCTALLAKGETATLTAALFGICSALRTVDGQEWTESYPTIERLTEHLAYEWTRYPQEFRESFLSGGFVSPMMAAASLEIDVPAAKKFREICCQEWRAVEASGTFSECPTLLWTGRRLMDNISPGSCVAKPIWWRSEISNLTSPYKISTSAIQQMVAALGAMTAFGRFLSPLPDLEKKYLEKTLPFLLFYHLKEQDLDLINPLLRALQYMRMSDLPEFAQGVGFVLDRNRPDGRFTMRDIVTHLHSLATQSPIDPVKSIHVPLTVSSIWSLVDCQFPSRGVFRILTSDVGG
jgi:hypothetical protein